MRVTLDKQDVDFLVDVLTTVGSCWADEQNSVYYPIRTLALRDAMRHAVLVRDKLKAAKDH